MYKQPGSFSRLKIDKLELVNLRRRYLYLQLVLSFLNIAVRNTTTFKPFVFIVLTVNIQFVVVVVSKLILALVICSFGYSNLAEMKTLFRGRCSILMLSSGKLMLLNVVSVHGMWTKLTFSETYFSCLKILSTCCEKYLMCCKVVIVLSKIHLGKFSNNSESCRLKQLYIYLCKNARTQLATDGGSLELRDFQLQKVIALLFPDELRAIAWHVKAAFRWFSLFLPAVVLYLLMILALYEAVI